MILTVPQNLNLVVPWSVLRRAGIKAGDRVEFSARVGMITIRKVLATRAQPKTGRTKQHNAS
jgi:bifunctional DNA-binding transcriptional regulator/antitoxin component of YhaV-PrlF toxin-antitoxin module